MSRRLLKVAWVMSLLLCAAVCVLWGARINRPRVGNGVLVFGRRYTLSLLPGRMALLGPPPVSRDPAVRKKVSEMSRALRASGGTLRYHGTTGVMGFDDFDFGAALGTHKDPKGEVDNAAIPMLLATLDDDRLFLVAHTLLSETVAGSEAANDPWLDMKFGFGTTGLWSGHWTGAYDGVNIDLVEDKPRANPSSWGDEIWAVVRTTAPPAERARVRDQWHRRLDVPVWTVRYWPVVLLTLGISAAGFALHFSDQRRRRRRASGLCPACGYDLRASKDRCSECGMTITSNSRPPA